MSADAIAIRHRLTDPVKLCRALGLFDGAKRQSGGLLVRCPSHNERTPSCSVTVGADGTVRAKCFGCDWTADVLGLIAQVRGLSLRSDFVGVMAAAAELAGDSPMPHRSASSSRPKPPEERAYPPRAEVLGLMAATVAVNAGADSWEALRGRAIDPDAVAERDLARALPVDAVVPRWARFRGATWPDLGYRLIVPMYDHRGELVSVRGWRIEETRDAELLVDATFEEVRAAQADRETLAKRLPPAGHRMSGCVMANRVALEMLHGKSKPSRLLIVEGEPDFLTWATLTEDAVIGINNGSWTRELSLAVPGGTEVSIRTHADNKGDSYAASVIESLERNCSLWRNT